MDRVRVASCQYFMRPVESFQQFAEQVEALTVTAADYRCRMIVFPEYFTCQLLSLEDIRRPIDEQIKTLAHQEERFVDFMQRLAKKEDIYIVAGTIPGFDHEKKDGKVFNRSHFFGPSGKHSFQNKLHMTRFEDEEWMVESGVGYKIFDTDFCKMAINICYDVEFPELARVAAKEGAQVLVTPSCTDDRQGFLRVRYCAHARAIENQMYVMHSGTCGSMPQIPAIALNYGQASILTPSDFSFARDGILAEGVANQESMVIGELNIDAIERSRREGTVLPLRDSQKTSVLMGVTTTERV